MKREVMMTTPNLRDLGQVGFPVVGVHERRSALHTNKPIRPKVVTNIVLNYLNTTADNKMGSGQTW
jgi:hypothetical protein